MISETADTGKHEHFCSAFVDFAFFWLKLLNEICQYLVFDEIQIVKWYILNGKVMNKKDFVLSNGNLAKFCSINNIGIENTILKISDQYLNQFLQKLL